MDISEKLCQTLAEFTAVLDRNLREYNRLSEERKRQYERYLEQCERHEVYERKRLELSTESNRQSQQQLDIQQEDSRRYRAKLDKHQRQGEVGLLIFVAAVTALVSSGLTWAFLLWPLE
jgi:dTDP-4-amino-4,6-dideoxygalactose transaminase